MRNVSYFNDIYNIQDVYIFIVILDNRWQKIKTGFDHRCFTSAGILSRAIERIKSKVTLTFPKDVETVHTRLGFDTEMFTPKSLEYVKENNEIVKKPRNLYSEKNAKAEGKKIIAKVL